MQDAGITNPESQDGINLCIVCPVEKCVEDERPLHQINVRGRVRKATARKLSKWGWSTKEIAERLGVDVGTVRKYIR